LIFQRTQGSNRPIHRVEQEALAIDHPEIGAWLLERWRLPTSLVSAVRYHHRPGDAPADVRTFCQLVHVADYVCSWQGLPGPGEQHLEMDDARLWTELGIEMSLLPELANAMAIEADRGMTFLAAAG
jgi:HD-like signal output (HDOD) protein